MGCGQPTARLQQLQSAAVVCTLSIPWRLPYLHPDKPTHRLVLVIGQHPRAGGLLQPRKQVVHQQVSGICETRQEGIACMSTVVSVDVDGATPSSSRSTASRRHLRNKAGGAQCV